MRLELGVCADYAVTAERGKLIIAGIFDAVHGRGPDMARQLPQFYLILTISASIARGTIHDVRVRMLNEDEEEVFTPLQWPQVPFTPTGPGRPIRVNLIVQVSHAAVPRFGEYRFEIAVDGKVIGHVPLYVDPAPES